MSQVHSVSSRALTVALRVVAEAPAGKEKHPLTPTHSLPLTHSLTLTPTPTHSLPLTHSHSLTHSLSLPLLRAHNHFWANFIHLHPPSLVTRRRLLCAFANNRHHADCRGDNQDNRLRCFIHRQWYSTSLVATVSFNITFSAVLWRQSTKS